MHIFASLTYLQHFVSKFNLTMALQSALMVQVRFREMLLLTFLLSVFLAHSGDKPIDLTKGVDLFEPKIMAWLNWGREDGFQKMSEEFVEYQHGWIRSALNAKWGVTLSYSMPNKELIQGIQRLFFPKLKKNTRIRGKPSFRIPIETEYRERTKIKIFKITLPQREISKTEKLSRLKIVIYICPSIETAQALYLVQERSAYRKTNSGAKIFPSRYRLPHREGFKFEQIYQIEQYRFANASPTEGEVVEPFDRIGVIRDSIVIEFQSTYFLRSKFSDKWLVRRMHSKDEEFIMNTLQEIGKYLK